MASNRKNKPLQSLLFLSRDWRESDWQKTNGSELLKNMLHNDQTFDNKIVQQHIPLSYDSVKCSILPHPGENIKSVFNHGQLSMVSDLFKDALKAIIEQLFCPTNLVTKKIGEFEITVSELLEFMKAYLEILQNTKSPTADLFTEKTVEIQMKTFVERDLAFFNEKLTTITIGNQNEINSIQNNILSQFKQRRTISNCMDMKDQFLKELNFKMKDSVLNWRKNPLTTPPGVPINLLSFVNEKPVLNIKVLTDVLMHPDVKKRKLVVFSITGITGTRRNFLLNYFLRYMYANVSMIKCMNSFKSISLCVLVQINKLQGQPVER